MSSENLREIKTILVATGLTPESVGGVLQAIKLSERLGAKLHAVHAIEPVSKVAERAVPGMAATHLKQAEEELEKFAASHDLAGRASLHVVKGDAETEILALRKEIKADLLIVGRYGKGGMKNGRLGSIATQLVRHCPTPVLVVPPEFRGDYERIGFSTDIEDPDTIEIHRVVRLAKAFGVSEVLGINAYELPRGYHTMYSWEGACEKISEAHKQEFESQYRAACEGVENPPRARFRIEHGAPAKTISEITGEEKLDLLVLGTHWRSPVARALLGRTSEKIIHEAGCSVWAEKSPKVYQGLLDAVKALMD